MEAACGIPARTCAPLCLGSLAAPQAALRLNDGLSFLPLPTVPTDWELGPRRGRKEAGGQREPELQALVGLEVGSEELARSAVLTWARPAFPSASRTPFPPFPTAPQLPGPLSFFVNCEHAGGGA